MGRLHPATARREENFLDLSVVRTVAGSALLVDPPRATHHSVVFLSHQQGLRSGSAAAAPAGQEQIARPEGAMTMMCDRAVTEGSDLYIIPCLVAAYVHIAI